jgi:DNA polymerase-3 subunit alpha (Gram-positive type)
MNGNFKKLLEQLELSDKFNVYQGKLKEITVDKTDDSWFFEIEFKKPLNIEDFEVFSNRMTSLPKRIKGLKECEYLITYKKKDDELLEDYYDFVLRSLATKKPRFSAILDFNIERRGNRIEVLCPKDGTFVNDLLYEIKSELLKLGFDARLATGVSKERPLIKDRMEKQDKKFSNEVRQIVETSPTEITFVSYDKKVIRNVKDTITDIPKSDSELIEYKSMNDSAFFSFQGEITKIDSRRINATTDLFTFIVSDDEDSIFVKKFIKDPVELKFHKGTKVGMLIKVKGVAQFDKFSDEVSITANVLERTTNSVVKDNRIDLQREKRVELHVHTKMSTLDGINSIGEYVETARKWGHQAIAVTDHSNVQSFPEFYKATKDGLIKPIYGAEFTFIDEEDLEIVKNPVDIKLDEAVYTVFDIETTGLSVVDDKIIEIAALRVKNGQILDEFQTYINPERPISELTTKITSITSSDVALAPTIDMIIGEFKQFIKGSIMVAHNAQFDMGFIYNELKNHDMYDGEMCNIDTLSFARNCYGDVLK